MTRIIFLFLLFSCISKSYSQTIGVLQSSPAATPGYTLLAPNSTDFVYLIDRCGRVVHEWFTDVRPGLRTILSKDGTLIRTRRQSGDFFGGGLGGGMDAYDWDNNLLWSFDYFNEDVHLHHDIDILPNGNFIAIAWERLFPSEAEALGRVPGTTNVNGMWPDHIIEYNPLIDSIVWSWHVKDHLIQDIDPALPSFGVVADHPELIDININSIVNGDWNHLNAIYYNASLDQIIVSSRAFSEIWIIDHSTTAAEAAGHAGGRWGRGGDLLYRWGNPQNYGRGDGLNKRLFGQHDARFIEEPAPLAGNILVYNNGSQRPDGQYSTVDMIVPPTDSEGNYFIENGEPFGPEVATTLVSGKQEDFDFYSDRISGAYPMSNGHILVCVGMDGRLMEFDTEGALIWDYVNPLNGVLPATQGSTPTQNQVFKVNHYDPDYPAFEGRDLTPGDPIEINPDISDCLLVLSDEEIDLIEWSVFPNPASSEIFINGDTRGGMDIFDINGRLVASYEDIYNGQNISVAHLKSGIYVLRSAGFSQRLVVAP